MFDVLILGSGPAGLSAAIYASRAKLSFVVIEEERGGVGQISGTSYVDNYPGLPGVSGLELGKALREHALSLGTEFCYGRISAIERADDGQRPYFKVFVNGENAPLEGRCVLYALGAEHSRLNIKGEEELLGCGICFCSVCDGMFFEHCEVAVIGGGNSALSDALHLSSIADKVYLIHRRDSFRASASLVEKIKNTPNIEPVLNAVPVEFEGEDELEGILLADGRHIAVQGAFEAVGMRPRSQLAVGLADLDKSGYIIADETGFTSTPGFFAAGDVRTKALRQIITAASDGAAAIGSISSYLNGSC